MTAAFDEQVKLFTELTTAWLKPNSPVDLRHEEENADAVRNLCTQLHKGVERCLRDMQTLWPMDEFVEATMHTSEPEDIHHPSQAYLVYRIGKMVTAWPNEPVSNEYAKYMSERLDAEGVNALILESVFREIADDVKRKKPPGNGEVLSLLKPHKSRWQQRMDAIDFEKITQRAQDTLFALDFKHEVFREALLEYLDAHGHTELAAEMRDDEADDPYAKARQILIDEKPVMLEWNLLLKNAQRRLNDDKEYACTVCGAGYYYEERCKVCNSTVITHVEWEQRITRQQEKLQTKLQEAKFHDKQRILLAEFHDKQRVLLDNLTNDDWLKERIELQKLKLPQDCYIEILHWKEVGPRCWVTGSAYSETEDALFSFDNPIPEREFTHSLLLPGVHFLMTCVYQIVEREKSYWDVDDEYHTMTCRELKLRKVVPYKYVVDKCEIRTCSALTEDERNAFDQLLLIDNPTIDEQAQLAELRAKLYAAYLPPPNMIAALQQMVSRRIEIGLPRSRSSLPLPLDPYERFEAELGQE